MKMDDTASQHRQRQLLVLSHTSSERKREAVFTTCCTPQPQSILISILFRANFQLTFSQVLLLFSIAFLLNQLGHFRKEEVQSEASVFPASEVQLQVGTVLALSVFLHYHSKTCFKLALRLYIKAKVGQWRENVAIASTVQCCVQSEVEGCDWWTG